MLSFQFLIRDGALNCIVTMRSSDVWLGIPYDIFTFTQIQNCYAGELGVTRGFLSLQMGSSHLYDSNSDAAEKLLHEVYSYRQTRSLFSPTMPGLPPNWMNDLLVTGDAQKIPVNADKAWLPYAHVLLSATSAEAREILRAASKSE